MVCVCVCRREECVTEELRGIDDVRQWDTRENKKSERGMKGVQRQALVGGKVDKEQKPVWNSSHQLE